MGITSAKGRWPVVLGIAAAILLMIGMVHQSQGHLPESTRKYWPFKPKDTQDHTQGEVTKLPPMQQPASSFYEIALKYGTDKVTDHSYQDMYEKYLPAIRQKRLKMLEIGLGCDMSYGPGASYYTWLEYLPNVDLYFLEYDAQCAEQWADKTTAATIITGDQGDGAFLDNLVSTYGDDFDIIIDDGGHTMEQQQTSLEHLWKAVKPGGMYFCEDLQTSYWNNYGGGVTAANGGKTTMMQYIHMLIEDLTWGERRVNFPGVDRIVDIDCSREVCGFFKRSAVTVGYSDGHSTKIGQSKHP